MIICISIRIVIMLALTAPFLIFIAMYLFNKLTVGRVKSFKCLVGKVAIVTGGHSGIGFEVALELAKRGCKVIIADISDGEKSRKKIEQETQNPNISTYKLDLSSFKSIRNFAQCIKKSQDRLDILINNAGIGASSVSLTEDGINPIFQVNSLGHFLLTHLLIDLLKKSAPSRIIFTSSMMAFLHSLNVNNLNFTKPLSNGALEVNKVFADANLVNIVIADGFAKKLDGINVTSNSLHTGVANTQIFNRAFKFLNVHPFYAYLINVLIAVFGKSPCEGAQTTLHLALSNDVEKITAQHFWDCKIFPKPRITKNEEFCQLVWKKCEELVKLEPQEKLP